MLRPSQCSLPSESFALAAGALPTASPQLDGARPTGAFALCVGRAMALTPIIDSLLRISQGGAWVTLPSQPGDHFLKAGESLRVPAGDAVVFEAWKMPATERLYFDWDPVPMRIAAPHSVGSSMGYRAREPARNAPWAQPLADLRAALVLAGRATVLAGAALLRLAGAFAAALTPVFAINFVASCAYSVKAVAGFFFSGVVKRAFKAQSKAKSAQGRMASCESIASSGAL